MYRRLYPVVRDKDTIVLRDGTNTSTITPTTAITTTNTKTLTNKTSDDTINTITCDKLRTATGTVTIKTATAPIPGQVLTATSWTTATWKNQSVITSVLGSLNITFMTSSYATAKVFMSSYHTNACVIDYNTITETGYYSDLPTSSVTHLQQYYVASANINQSYEVIIRDSTNKIYPEGGGAGVHMISLPFDTLVSFTYYTSNMPNAGAITYPAWYMDDDIYTSNKIPIPPSVNIIYVMSYQASNPFSYFISSDDQINYQPLEIVDIGGYLNFTAIAVSVSTGTFRPANASFHVLNTFDGLYRIYRIYYDWFVKRITFS